MFQELNNVTLQDGDFIPLRFFNLFPPGGWFALFQVLNTGLIIFGSAGFSFTIDMVPETHKFCNITLTKRSLAIQGDNIITDMAL